MKKVAVYIRVSTYEQNETSQKEALEKFCESHHYSPTFYIDKATGTNLSRPAFEKLQKALFAKEYDTVIIYKLDRLSRSLSDGIKVISQWLEQDIRLIASSQQFDFSGAMGKMIASLLLGVAEMEQETRKERQALGIQSAKKKGVFKGRKKGTKTIDRAEVSKLLEKGYKQKDIAKLLGATPWTISVIKRELKEAAEAFEKS